MHRPQMIWSYQDISIDSCSPRHLSSSIAPWSFSTRRWRSCREGAAIPPRADAHHPEKRFRGPVKSRPTRRFQPSAGLDKALFRKRSDSIGAVHSPDLLHIGSRSAKICGHRKASRAAGRASAESGVQSRLRSYGHTPAQSKAEAFFPAGAAGSPGLRTDIPQRACPRRKTRPPPGCLVRGICVRPERGLPKQTARPRARFSALFFHMLRLFLDGFDDFFGVPAGKHKGDVPVLFRRKRLPAAQSSRTEINVATTSERLFPSRKARAASYACRPSEDSRFPGTSHAHRKRFFGCELPQFLRYRCSGIRAGKNGIQRPEKICRIVPVIVNPLLWLQRF